MKAEQIGSLLRVLRLEKGFTQKAVADFLGLSDKTVSKWERGLGCPDISLLGDLSSLLGVTIESLLQGDLQMNTENGGNMRHMAFYQCPACGNLLTGTGTVELTCCGRKLEALKPEAASDDWLQIEEIENDYYIQVSHEMTKANHLTFAAYVTNDRLLLIKLYPEQEAHFRVPKLFGGTLYIGNNVQKTWMKRLVRRG